MARFVGVLVLGRLLSGCVGTAGSFPDDRHMNGGDHYDPDARVDNGADGGVDPGAPPTPACAADEASLDEAVARFQSDVTEAGVPGGAIAIVCGGEIVRAAGVGTVSAGGAAVDADTRFQMASVTKSFTATAVMSLVDDGVMALDAPVDLYVPFVNTSAPFDQSFTVAQVLSHTSGYASELNSDQLVVTHSDLEGYFTDIGALPLWSPPGAVWNYGNYAYSLLGLAAQQASGRSFAELCDERVFLPAGMTRATLDANRVVAEGNFATGHVGSADTPLGPLDHYYHEGWYGPMGGAWASVTDMAQFGRTLMGLTPGVVSERSLAAMETRQSATTDRGFFMGYGLFINPGSATRLSHTGSVSGFEIAYVVIPEAGIGVFAAVNGDWWFPGALVDEGADALAGFEHSDEWPTPYPEDALLGTYQAQSTYGAVVVQRGRNGLELSFPDLGVTEPLTAYGSDSFWFDDPIDGYETIATFWNEGGAAPTYVVARTFVGAR